MRRRDVVGMIGLTVAAPSIGAYARRHFAIGGHVVVDPRIELMSAIHLLGGYFLTSQVKSAYREEALKFFAPYRDHPVVVTAKTLAGKSLAFDAVPDLMLRLTEPPALAGRTDLVLAALRGFSDEAQRNAFVVAMRDFAQLSRFADFFQDHRSLYQRICDRVAPMVGPSVQALQAYVGTPLDRWQVIAAPLMHDGGFGPRLRRRDGKLETYALIGPDAVSGDTPSFGDRARLQDLVVHEFAHSLVNPIAESQPSVVARYAARFDALRPSMKKEGYGDWTTVVNEHVVRAVTARVAARKGGEGAGSLAVAAEIAHGFVYVPALVERLRQYETDRRRWPTLSDFYPTLMEAFDQSIPPVSA